MNRKAIIAFAIGLALLTLGYWCATSALGMPPGLYVPSAIFFWTWTVGKLLTEGFSTRDRERWVRTIGAIGAVVAIFAGLSFVVVVHAQASPPSLVGRGVLDAFFGFLAVFVGSSLPAAKHR